MCGALLVGGMASWASADDEQPPAQPLIERLDDLTRAKVLSALAALIILGLAMMVLAWLGARITRRYMNSPTRYQPPRRTNLDLDDWAHKPLIDKLTEEDSDENPDDIPPASTEN